MKDRVIEIDAPKEAPILRHVIAFGDTVVAKPKSACSAVKPTPGARSYLAVLGGGEEVPDSVRVVLANGAASFWIHRWKGK